MANDICKSLGERIRELRQKRKWRQVDLAQEVGISENYVSDLELGRKEVCLRTIKALADAFKISISELTKGVS
jgi:transcriptional regulator with XRE-family HTH domain